MGRVYCYQPLFDGKQAHPEPRLATGTVTGKAQGVVLNIPLCDECLAIAIKPKHERVSIGLKSEPS